MSYCVNCGVELEESLKRCPLCSTEVVNPRLRLPPDPAARPYPSKVEQLERRAARRVFVALAMLMLVIPPVVCLICDVLAAGRVTWSAYVLGATALAYAYVLLPCSMERPRAWLCLLVDCAVTLLFLFAIDWHLSGGWFTPLALPLTLTASVAVAAVVLLFKKCRARFLCFAGLLLAAGALCALVDLWVSLYLGYTPVLSWSFFVFPLCIILAAAALVLNKRAKFKDEVKRRFFI